MIIHGISLRNVGPFNGSFTVEGFTRGINVLAAPNESGKSSLINAAIRCLFEKHLAKHLEIRKLQPAATDLAPFVEVDFEIIDGHYKIAKKFLHNPSSVLSVFKDGKWSTVAEADQADDRLTDILNAERPGRGPTHLAHWGLFQFLWGRQGEAIYWPSFEGSTGDYVRSRLARVDMDPLVDTILSKLEAIWSSQLTQTGLEKSAGNLKNALTQKLVLEKSLSDIHARQNDLATNLLSLEALTPKIKSLESELIDIRDRKILAQLHARQAEQAENELKLLQFQLDAAESNLQKIHRDSQTSAASQSSLNRIAHERKSINQNLDSLQKKSTEVQLRLTTLQESSSRIETDLIALRKTHDRLLALFRLVEKRRQSDDLHRQLEFANQASLELESINLSLASLPDLSQAHLESIESLQRTARDIEIQIQSLGLKVQFIPDSSGRLTARQTEEGTISESAHQYNPGLNIDFAAPQKLSLHLDGIGSIIISSGALEPAALTRQKKDLSTRLEQICQDLRLNSPFEAKDIFSKIKNLQNKKSSIQETLKSFGSHTSSSPALIKQSIARIHEELSHLKSQFQFSEIELNSSIIDLESLDLTQKTAISSLESAFQKEKTASQSLQSDRISLTTSIHSLEAQLNQLSIEESIASHTLSDLHSIYPLGIQESLNNIQSRFVQAEARCIAKKAELPTEYKDAAERAIRLTKGENDVLTELDSCRRSLHQLQGDLNARGADGLHSQETQILENLEQVNATILAEKKRAYAARLAHELLQRRKLEATRTIIQPLESKLSNFFSAMSGIPQRQVYLNENLQLSRIGKGNEFIEFDQLSQGAKEQLLLALRLAVASELSDSFPQTLILDDVLVNSDRSRQENIISTLTSMASRLQIIILTCHPDWYRGAGNILSLTARTSSGDGT